MGCVFLTCREHSRPGDREDHAVYRERRVPAGGDPEGFESVHIDLPVGARHVQVQYRGEDGGAEARAPARVAGGAGDGAARPRRETAATVRSGTGHRCAKGQVRGVHRQEGGARAQESGMHSPPRARQ